MVLVSTENKCYSFHGSVGVVMFDCKVLQLLQYYLLNSLSTAFFRKKNRYETTYIRPSRSDLVLFQDSEICKSEIPSDQSP